MPKAITRKVKSTRPRVLTGSGMRKRNLEFINCTSASSSTRVWWCCRTQTPLAASVPRRAVGKSARTIWCESPDYSGIPSDGRIFCDHERKCQRGYYCPSASGRNDPSVTETLIFCGQLKVGVFARGHRNRSNGALIFGAQRRTGPYSSAHHA